MSTDSHWPAHASKAILVAAVAALVCLPPSDANARTVQRTARSGQPTRTATIRAWDDETCRSMGTKADVVERPKHGKVTPRIVNTSLHTAPEDAGATPSQKCVGVPVKVLQLDYTSVRGFHGTDEFTVTISLQNGTSETITYIMTVQ